MGILNLPNMQRYRILTDKTPPWKTLKKTIIIKLKENSQDVFLSASKLFTEFRNQGSLFYEDVSWIYQKQNE